MTRRDLREHYIGDECPGSHYASPGAGGLCCQAAEDLTRRQHAWNCRMVYEPDGRDEPAAAYVEPEAR